MRNNSWGCIWCEYEGDEGSGPYVKGNLLIHQILKQGLCYKCAEEIAEQVEKQKKERQHGT